MATVTIEVKQVRTIEEGPLYQVDTDVLRAQNIDQNIFVFVTATDEFSRVATTWDMQEFPSSKEQAELDGNEFYRHKQAVVSYADENVASNYAAYTLARIRYLMQAYQTVSDDFVGSATYTYTGEN